VVAELELGDYPAIEALAFAVIEMLDCEGRRQAYAGNDYSDDYKNYNPINHGSRGENPLDYN